MVALNEHVEFVAATQTETVVTLPFQAGTILLFNAGPAAIDFTLDDSVATFRGARLPSGASLTIDRSSYKSVMHATNKVRIICATATTATVTVNAWPM